MVMNEQERKQEKQIIDCYGIEYHCLNCWTENPSGKADNGWLRARWEKDNRVGNGYFCSNKCLENYIMYKA